MSNVANSRTYEQQRILEDLNGQNAEIHSNPFKMFDVPDFLRCRFSVALTGIESIVFSLRLVMIALDTFVIIVVSSSVEE